MRLSTWSPLIDITGMVCDTLIRYVLVSIKLRKRVASVLITMALTTWVLVTSKAPVYKVDALVGVLPLVV